MLHHLPGWDITTALMCTAQSHLCVLQVLDKVGLPPSVLSSDSAAPLLAAWGEADLHRLVATFLCVRFPVSRAACMGADWVGEGTHSVSPTIQACLCG
jgi:hypothetical protein